MNLVIPLKQILDHSKDKSKTAKDMITKAYNLSKQVHKGQKFDGTKHPYFLHPAYAGFLLAKWGRGWESICAGLLHDVVEDCDISLTKLSEQFGQKTAFYVDGMSWERKWNKQQKRYLKDRKGFYQKIMECSKKDTEIVIIRASDELSKLSDLLGKKVEKTDEPKEKTKKRHAWIMKIMVPFYREVGLTKVADSVCDKLVVGKMKSKLSKYISKQDLKKLKSNLAKVKGIEDLR